MYCNEGYGAAKITSSLNDEGLKTKRGSGWSQTAVSRMLKNKLYAGKIINGKEEIVDFLTGVRKAKDKEEWIVVDRPDLQIIEPDLFKKAQDIASRRNQAFNAGKERQSNKHLFSTLIKCSGCGYSFRRTLHTYKNTYIRWVCSGRNTKGSNSCNNKTVVDEVDLVESLQEYFVNIISKKPSIIKHASKGFISFYKSKSDDKHYESELRVKLSKSQKTRQKYIDMYTDDLISHEELKNKMIALKVEIEKIENNLKLTTYNLDKGNQLEDLLARTFNTIEDIVSMDTITNAGLKQIIKKIVVNADGDCDIYLHLFGDIGLDETYLIKDNQTQRCN